MIRVRFLRAKRYPHPDGRRREVNEIVSVDEDTAARWEHAGLVEYVDALPEEPIPALDDLTVPELRTLAMQLALDLSGLRKKADIAAVVRAEILARTTLPGDPGQVVVDDPDSLAATNAPASTTVQVTTAE